jgi:hypothetical protein
MRAAILALFSTLVLAGCGTGSVESSSGDDEVVVATVGERAISKADVDALLDEAAVSFRALGRPFPEKGTPYYLDLRDRAVVYLVEQSAKEQEAERLGAAVDPADVERDLERVDQEAFREQSDRAGLTMDRVRADVQSWRLRLALFKAVVSRKEAGETNFEVMQRWEEQLRAQIAATEYAPGWRPAKSLRSPVPPELQDLPKPRGGCELEEGTFTLQELAAHGCITKLGVGIPGVDATPCREIPVDVFGIAPLAEDAAYGAYESQLMNTAPSCVSYPETEYTFTSADETCEACRFGTPNVPASGNDRQSPNRQ